MNRKLQGFALAASLLLLGGGLWLWVGRMRSAPAEEEHGKTKAAPIAVPMVRVRRGGLDERIELSGVIRPLPEGRARLAPQVAGRLLSLSAQPGQQVQAGQILAVVEHRDLTADIARARATLAEAQRETEALRGDLRAQEAAQKNSVLVASATVEAAQSRRDRIKAGNRKEDLARSQANLEAFEQDLSRLRAGARPQELAQARAAVLDAEAEVEARQRDAERKTQLFERGIVAGKDRDRAVADLAQARAKLTTAQQAEALVKEGPRREDIGAAEARVREARAALDLLLAGSRPEEIAEAEAGVREARAKLDDARAGVRQLTALRARIRGAVMREDAAQAIVRAASTQQDRSYLRAPFSGTVVDVTASVGEQTSNQTPILEVVNPSALRAVVQVPARYRSLLAPGAPLELRLPGGGAPLAVSVHHLSPGADPESEMFAAEAWLPRAAPGWRDGVLVTASARSSHAGDGLVIPARALFDRAGEQYVYAVNDGKVLATRVEVSGEDGERASLRSGLKDGQLIVADGSLSLADEAAVETK